MSKKFFQKIKKTSKNLLTIKNVCDIITKLSPKRGAGKRSLKIEQRREKYKHKYVRERNSKISERKNTTQTKVREAKIALEMI